MRVVIITTFIVILFFAISLLVIGKHEEYECNKWERMEEQYENFYYTEWQQEQCGIE